MYSARRRGDVFADAVEPKTFTCDERAAFEAEVADGSTMQREAAAIVDEIVRVALCQIVESAVAGERGCSVLLAPAVHCARH